VVEIAAGGASRTAGKPASAVTDPQVPGEVGGHSVGVATVRQVRAGLGVGEDPLERRRVRGQTPGGLGVDRAVPVETADQTMNPCG
jgi:hypothetical protein